jgi:FdhD protein
MRHETNQSGVRTTRYRLLAGGEWSSVTGPIIEEALVSIFANGQEIATMMATPRHHECLAVGYLFTEGLISRREDVLNVSLAPNRSCVDVLLARKEIALPPRRILTSGCGRGITYSSYPDEDRSQPGGVARPGPVTSDLEVSPDCLQSLMRTMQKASPLHQEAGGIHAAGLGSRDGLVVVMEDIGRHNTLDKLAGYCLLNGIDPTDHVLLTTGRISSEMVNKALRMGLPVVASLTSPTSLAVERAEADNLTLVGYVRGHRLRVYTHPERIELAGEAHETTNDQD